MTTPTHDPDSPSLGEGSPSSESRTSPASSTPHYGPSHETPARNPNGGFATPYGPSYPVTAYPVGGYGTEQQGPPPKKTLGIWALVLGWVPFFPGWIACVVLAIIVFTRSRPGQDHGKKLAIFGLAGVGLYVLLIGAVFIWSPFGVHRDSTGHVTSAGDVTIDGMRVGDCGSNQLHGLTSTVHLVPCSDPHASQVMATFELKGAAYPGDDVVTRLSEGGCVKRLRGMPQLAGRSDLQLLFLHPVAGTWRNQKTVVCLAVSDQPLTGSLLSR